MSEKAKIILGEPVIPAEIYVVNPCKDALKMPLFMSRIATYEKVDRIVKDGYSTLVLTEIIIPLTAEEMKAKYDSKGRKRK